MKISFAITTHNEGSSLRRLLIQLKEFIEECETEDEIVILDDYSDDDETSQIIEEYSSLEYVVIDRRHLNRNFAEQKNHLNSMCTGDYIFQIDADELISEVLLESLHSLLEENKQTDLFLVPRVNTVEGLTEEHIALWNWRVNDIGWVMWPDYQTRIYRNSPDIVWYGAVHERIDGFSSYAHLPAEEQYAIIHDKSIERQEEQNTFYEQIVNES